MILEKDFIEYVKKLERRIYLLETPKLKYFDDSQVPATSLKSGGTGIPSFDAFLGNTLCYAFTDESVAGNEKRIYFNIQLPHRWKEGSAIEPHVHYAPSTNGGGVIRWELEYTWANIDGTFGAPTSIYCEDDVGTTANAHRLVSFGTISATGKTASSILVCKLQRNSSHANDTYANKVFLLSLDAHFESDKLGEPDYP